MRETKINSKKIKNKSTDYREFPANFVIQKDIQINGWCKTYIDRIPKLDCSNRNTQE